MSNCVLFKVYNLGILENMNIASSCDVQFLEPTECHDAPYVLQFADMTSKPQHMLLSCPLSISIHHVSSPLPIYGTSPIQCSIVEFSNEVLYL
ncbi:hypothetical protein RJT34_13073 [Clitoria ternatea]|uniref:Uncharacterized protein n=1 Tax=Clitoria ternatea TaxID=43366 RepID=A0AAN9JQ87_CLITE